MRMDFCPSDTRALVPDSSPPPPTRILKSEVPCTIRVLAAARTSAVPMESRCLATNSSGFMSAAHITTELAARIVTILTIRYRGINIVLREKFMPPPFRAARKMYAAEKKPAGVNPQAARLFLYFSETHLERHLQLPGRGGSIGPGRGGVNQAEVGRGNAVGCAIRPRVVKVRMVEYVVSFHSQFGVNPFRDFCRLGPHQVKIDEPWSIKVVAPGSSGAVVEGRAATVRAA